MGTILTRLDSTVSYLSRRLLKNAANSGSGSDPLNWTKATLYTNWDDLHQEQSPSTPYTIPEFQGGALDSW